MKNRIFSLLLALVMMVGMLSVTALAEESSAVSLAATSGDEDFYPGSTVTVTVSLSQSGYAGLVLKTTCGDLVQNGLEVADELGGYSLSSAGNTIWVNCNVDENGNLVLNEGEDAIVNTTYTGLIANLTYTIPADAKAGDTFTVTATVDAVDADETVVLDGATGSTTITVVERPYVLGDVNEDGAVDFSDAFLVAAYFMDNATFTETQKLAGDMNNDGAVDFSDAFLIAQAFMS